MIRERRVTSKCGKTVEFRQKADRLQGVFDIFAFDALFAATGAGF